MSIRRSRYLATTGALLIVTPRAVRAQTLEKIRLTGVPTDDMTPVYYAIKSGMYQRAGLDVEIIPSSSGSVATTAVVAGTYEMGKGSLMRRWPPTCAGPAHDRCQRGAVGSEEPVHCGRRRRRLTDQNAADCNGSSARRPV